MIYKKINYIKLLFLKFCSDYKIKENPMSVAIKIIVDVIYPDKIKSYFLKIKKEVINNTNAKNKATGKTGYIFFCSFGLSP